MSAAYLAQKASVGYAETGGSRKCSACANACRPWGPDRLQCHVIGVRDDPDADVLPGAGCKAWKVRLR
jgi:hypothetical protein